MTGRHGGARKKVRPDDPRGGAREGAGPTPTVAGLEGLIDTLSRRLGIARKRKALTYSEALALFQRLDHLTTEAEYLLVETPDYPDDEDDGDEPIII